MKGWALACLVMLPATAAAQWRWMEQSAATSFTPEDWQALESAAYESLNAPEVGHQANWRNPATHANGAVNAFADVRDVPLPCRRAAFRVEAAGKSGQGVYVLCKQPDGRWQFVTDSEIKAWQQATALGSAD